MEIRIEHLSKSYGKKQVLKDISLSIPEGMYGLLGRNGAGKTTLMRILATLSKGSGGTVLINSIPVEEIKKVRKVLGYLPQDFSFYPNMTVVQALEYLGILSEIPSNLCRKRTKDLLEKVNLMKNANTKIKALSGGMKQRFGIAQALLNQPQILIVDEPTAGLDPEERIRLRNLLCEFAAERIVLLSTHIAQDIENTCERIAVLDEGAVIFQGMAQELSKMAEGKVYIIEAALEEIPAIKGKYRVLRMQGRGDRMLCRIISDAIPSEQYVEGTPTIEDGYMEVLNRKGGCHEVI